MAKKDSRRAVISQASRVQCLKSSSRTTPVKLSLSLQQRQQQHGEGINAKTWKYFHFHFNKIIYTLSHFSRVPGSYILHTITPKPSPPLLCFFCSIVSLSVYRSRALYAWFVPSLLPRLVASPMCFVFSSSTTTSSRICKFYRNLLFGNENIQGCRFNDDANVINLIKMLK